MQFQFSAYRVEVSTVAIFVAVPCMQTCESGRMTGVVLFFFESYFNIYILFYVERWGIMMD